MLFTDEDIARQTNISVKMFMRDYNRQEMWLEKSKVWLNRGHNVPKSYRAAPKAEEFIGDEE